MPSTIIKVTASARESDVKKGMDSAQITGAASSYARKYALGGLFCLDDNKDPDTNEHQEQLDKAQAREDKEITKIQDTAYTLAVNLGYKDAGVAFKEMSSKKDPNYYNATLEEMKGFVAVLKKKVKEKEGTQ
jgi:hypothetical protein